MKLRVRTFGEAVMYMGDERITPDAEIVFALLLILVHEIGKPVARERLMRLLWENDPSSREKQRLRQTIYKAKQQFGVPLEVSGNEVTLRHEDVDSDVSALLESGWQDHFLNSPPPNGEYLPGYAPGFSRPFAEWLETNRDTIHSRTRIALARALAELRSSGEWSRIEELAQRCLLFDPHNDEATVVLAETMAARGRSGDALAVLDSYINDGAPQRSRVSSGASSANVLRNRIAERMNAQSFGKGINDSFVGRAESLSLLHSAVKRTRAGTSTSVFLWGEPGIGKTRLVEEFCRSLTVSDVVVASVTCAPSDTQRPLSVFADLCPQLRSMPGALGCSPMSLQYLDRLASGGSTEDELLRHADDAEMLSAGIRKAVFDLLDAVSFECRIVIAIEDAHWADQASNALLLDIINWCGSRSLQFVLTSRTPPLLGRAVALTGVGDRLIIHRLPGLSNDAASMLLASIAMSHEVTIDAPFSQWAVRVAEGNPFFLRELFAQWRQTGAPFSVPTTLSSLLTARIVVLDRQHLRLLQACAVLHRNSRIELLRTLLGYSNSEIIESLEVLGEAGLVSTTGEHIECRHNLIADAALRQMSDAMRQALYRMSAEVIEGEVARAPTTALLWDCARLWYDSGDEGRAVKTSLLFGDALVAMGHPGDAAKVLESILELCTIDEHRKLVYSALCRMHQLSASWKALISAITEHDRLAGPVARLNRHSEMELHLLDARWRVEGEPSAVLGRVEECLRSQHAHPTHRLTAATLALNIADGMCYEQKAREIFDHARQIPRDDESTNAVTSRLDLMFHTAYGHLPTALASAKHHIRIERSSGHPPDLARALRFASMVFRRTGEHSSAIACLEEALDVARQSQMRTGVVAALVGLCGCQIELGDFGGASETYATACSVASDAEDRSLPLDLSGLGIVIAVNRGDFEQAQFLASGLPTGALSDTVLRRRIYATAVFILAQSSASFLRSNHLLNELDSMHLLARRYGGQDTSATALCKALLLVGNQHQASRRWHEYVAHFRREAWPIATPSFTGSLDFNPPCDQCNPPANA